MALFFETIGRKTATKLALQGVSSGVLVTAAPYLRYYLAWKRLDGLCKLVKSNSQKEINLL
jgi:hypothetical protein